MNDEAAPLDELIRFFQTHHVLTATTAVACRAAYPTHYPALFDNAVSVGFMAIEEGDVGYRLTEAGKRIVKQSTQKR